MLKKKICLLGSYGVGKTSLVARFVHSLFADKYHTTVGVKIDKKVLSVGERELTLMLWDMAGEEDNAPLKLNQVKDAAGYLLVADGLRAKTLDIAVSIQSRVEQEIGVRPFLLLLNKADEHENWEIQESAWLDLEQRNWHVLKTSAKSGLHVEDAFLALATAILKEQDAGAESEDD
jgi:small GTP-binding protein